VFYFLFFVVLIPVIGIIEAKLVSYKTKRYVRDNKTYIKLSRIF
jgi:hypothetical protein